jgi:hypothetical protein
VAADVKWVKSNANEAAAVIDGLMIAADRFRAQIARLTAERDALRAKLDGIVAVCGCWDGDQINDYEALTTIEVILDGSSNEQRTSVGDCLQTRDQMLSGLERGGISDE